MAEDKFYIVWGEQSKTPPTVKHSSQSEAEAEATRLASTNFGKFYVLEAKTASAKVDGIDYAVTTPEKVS